MVFQISNGVVDGTASDDAGADLGVAPGIPHDTGFARCCDFSTEAESVVA